MRDVVIITKNVLRLIFRKKSSILVFMLLPIMCIFVSKYLNTSKEQFVKIGICDEDKSTLSKDLTKYLISKDKVKAFAVNKNNIDKSILNQEVDSVVFLNKGFEEELIKNKFSKLDLISVKGSEVTVWQENYLNYYISNILDISKSCMGDSNLFFKVYNDFKNKKINIKDEKVQDITNSIGVSKQSIAFLLVFMLTGATLSAGTIAKDKSTRVFKRIISSPIKIYNYILGNVLANFLLNIIQITVIIVSAKFLNLDFHIKTLDLFIILGAFSLVSVGLGMFIASVSNSSAQVSQISNAIIVPTCMLSGCFWPLEFMPQIMQKIALLLPQTWVIKIVGNLQGGGAISSNIINIIVIILFAIILFLASVFNIKKDEEIGSYV